MILHVVSKSTGCGTDILGIYSTKEKAIERANEIMDRDWCKYRLSYETSDDVKIWDAVNYDDIFVSIYKTVLDKEY